MARLGTTSRYPGTGDSMGDSTGDSTGDMTGDSAGDSGLTRAGLDVKVPREQPFNAKASGADATYKFEYFFD